MGLSTVTPRSFNSTGAQSICRANAPEEERLIESDFLTKCQVSYIHGSGETTVRGSLNRLPNSSLPNSPLNQDTFYLESDVDAISDINLSVSLDIPGSQVNKPQISVTKDFLLSLINRIEIRVGGLTIQTVTPEEIFMRNMTEQASGSLDNWLSSGVTGQYKDGFRIYPFNTTVYTSGYSPLFQELRFIENLDRGTNIMVPRGDTTYTWTISIPFNGRSNNMKHCFLQSGAVTNSITVNVYYNAAFPETSRQFTDLGATPHSRGILGFIRDSAHSTATLTGETFVDSFKSWLTVKTHVFTETESNFVKKNIVNRTITASQSVVRQIKNGETLVSDLATTPRNGGSLFAEGAASNVINFADIYSSSQINGTVINNSKETIAISIDLSSVDIIASHLLISAFCPVHNEDGSVSVPPFEIDEKIMNNTNGPSANYGASEVTYIDYGNLNLGAKDPVFISTESLSFTGYSIGSKEKCVTPGGYSIRGVLTDWLDSVEVKLGSDSTGRIPAGSLLKTAETFGLKGSNGAPIYVVPLADTPFSTAGIPMARVGNKQGILHVPKAYAMYLGPFTDSTVTNFVAAGNTPSDITSGTVSGWAPNTKVAVVAVGTRVQTTVGGGTSFAA